MPRRWHPVTGALLVFAVGLIVLPVGLVAGWSAPLTLTAAFGALGALGGFAVSGST